MSSSLVSLSTAFTLTETQQENTISTKLITSTIAKISEAFNSEEMSKLQSKAGGFNNSISACKWRWDANKMQSDQTANSQF